MNKSSDSMEDQSITLKGGEASDYISKLISVTSFGLLILIVATIVRLIQKGPYIHYWILGGGGLLSIMSLFGFSVIVPLKKKRSLGSMLLAFSLFIPYLYGGYLCLYEGLWRLFQTFSAFSVSSLVLSILFTVLGYKVVTATYKVTEFGKSVDAGKIRVEDAKS